MMNGIYIHLLFVEFLKKSDDLWKKAGERLGKEHVVSFIWAYFLQEWGLVQRSRPDNRGRLGEILRYKSHGKKTDVCRYRPVAHVPTRNTEIKGKTK